MLAIRRVSMHCCRNQRLSFLTVRICCGKRNVAGSCGNYASELVEMQGASLNRFLSSPRVYSSSSYGKVYSFSSQAGTESHGDEFNDLENSMTKEIAFEDENHDTVLSSKQELYESDEDDVSEELFGDLETFSDGFEIGGGRKIQGDVPVLSMVKAIITSPKIPVITVVNKWLEEGNELTKAEISSAMFHLKKRKLFTKAFELSEWLAYNNHVDLSERYHASHVDLTAKIRGVYKAEEYVCNIPKAFRGALVYQALLAGCVAATNLKKSEEVFSKMKELHIPLSCFVCNKMLLLYRKTDERKIPHILRLMEEENVQPSLFTYEVLINWKGHSNDIEGMEKLVETLQSKGLKLNSRIQASLAKNYVAAGLKDKAEEILKKMENGDVMKNRWACRWLLQIYASLGREDEVERIWKVCEPEARLSECMAAIEAWGSLGRVENAEAAFETLVQRSNVPSTRHIAFMLRVYANHKMLAKGTDLVKRMSGMNCRIGPLAWDALVKLYIGAGEIGKAASVIEKGIEAKSGRPMFISFMAVMEKFAEKGDVHNAEKVFMMMEKAGYAPGVRQFQSLLDAYVNSNTPAYGFIKRMRADNIFPNRALAAKLAHVDAFQKASILELL